MTKTKQTAKSISEDIVNILQPDLPFEEYKAKAEGIQVLIDQAIATATQQAVESERSRLQIKTAVNIMLTRLTPDECTEVMEKIYPEGIVIRPEEREALSQKGSE